MGKFALALLHPFTTSARKIDSCDGAKMQSRESKAPMGMQFCFQHENHVEGFRECEGGHNKERKSDKSTLTLHIAHWDFAMAHTSQVS